MKLWLTQHDGLYKGTDCTGVTITLHQMTTAAQEWAHLIGQCLKYISLNVLLQYSMQFDIHTCLCLSVRMVQILENRDTHVA